MSFLSPEKRNCPLYTSVRIISIPECYSTSGRRQTIQSFLNDFIPVNPLSPNSDQDQFSPNNIHTLSTDKL